VRCTPDLTLSASKSAKLNETLLLDGIRKLAYLADEQWMCVIGLDVVNIK